MNILLYTVVAFFMSDLAVSLIYLNNPKKSKQNISMTMLVATLQLEIIFLFLIDIMR